MTDEATAPATDARPIDSAMAPGGPRALAAGCVCSVLANAAYRAGAAEEPCLDPRCVLHAGGGTAS
ncbi:hypothetical protein SAMN05443637_120137 [Pseudonocardia thermophila]|jgi:hypothetical protein|uniref:Uncharacterized protein n=1 Tax=Pseudonocardia thermophila TaxID=1848 RepID=A0A1M6YN12_PSETH|nr:hypothetical protein [Pseudonocardia thermophila]SHL19638.1 hypothetical protein SAMN05443637_120137 [Pseudonocardia thermophila]